MNRLTDSLNFQTQALTLRSERQRLIASNIANADTPGYVARELDFATALRHAAARIAPDATGGNRLAVGSATALAATQPGHLAGVGSAGGAAAPLTYAVAAQTNLDRNSVDMDRERASFADNTVKYEATLRFINGQVRTMLSAITGQ